MIFKQFKSHPDCLLLKVLQEHLMLVKIGAKISPKACAACHALLWECLSSQLRLFLPLSYCSLSPLAAHIGRHALALLACCVHSACHSVFPNIGLARTVTSLYQCFSLMHLCPLMAFHCQSCPLEFLTRRERSIFFFFIPCYTFTDYKRACI